MTDTASLLLVAHGSTRFPDAARDLYRIADRLRPRFARVDIAFWRQEPLVSPDLLQGDEIYVLPYFAGLGKHTEQLIPRKLGLSGKLTERGKQRIHYCPPVGCHPGLPALIHRRALAAAADPAETALLLIGHGSQEGTASRTPEAIVTCLRALGGFAEVTAVYLEQAPFAAKWRDVITARQVIAQPLLLSAGMHASADLPPLFSGPDVVLLQGIGSDDEIVAMILDQVKATHS